MVTEHCATKTTMKRKLYSQNCYATRAVMEGIQKDEGAWERERERELIRKT